MCVGRGGVVTGGDLCFDQLAGLITHSAIFNFFICLISKCDCSTTPAHADKCKGPCVEEAKINMNNFSTGPLQKKKKKKREERNVVRAQRRNKSHFCRDMM